MKLAVRIAFTTVLALAVASMTAATSAKPKSAGKPTVRVRGVPMTVGKPLTYENLTVFPVQETGKGGVPTGYLSLEEALKKRLIKVSEVADGGDVNSVIVTSKTKAPIYLMSGDIILGGQQDRQIQDDTIIPPSARKMRVPVFCVEHGRWTGGEQFTGNTVASGKLRLETQQSRDQQQVWDTVAAEAKQAKAITPTGTYRAVAEGKVMKAKVDRYTGRLSAGLRKDNNCVGIIVAVNGKVTAADIFGNRTLWRKQMTKTVKSYALDAARSHAQWWATKKKAVARPAEAVALLADYGKGKRTTLSNSPTMRNAQVESPKAMSFEAVPCSPSKTTPSFSHINIYNKSANPAPPTRTVPSPRTVSPSRPVPNPAHLPSRE